MTKKRIIRHRSCVEDIEGFLFDTNDPLFHEVMAELSETETVLSDKDKRR